MDNNKGLKGRIDWFITLVPLVLLLILSAIFIIAPEQSKLFVSTVRGFLGDEFGLYYMLLGAGIFLATMYIAFSRFGKIKLGGASEKPQYPSFTWG